jgi:DNA-binding transcriptional ArsR family regulator
VKRGKAFAFIDCILDLAAAIAASSRELGTSYTGLRVLRCLSVEKHRAAQHGHPCGMSVEQLAERMMLSPATVSATLTELRRAGLVAEARCSAHPTLCDSGASGRGCGKHRLQFVTELGEEMAEEWLRPYVDLLLKVEPRLWLQMARRFRRVGPRRRRPGRRATRDKRAA